jgi:hypothetical protein
MPTTFINLADLDTLIHKLEQKYNASSFEMLKDGDVRERIPEDVLLRWETYVYQRAQLRDLYERTRSEYLSKLRVKTNSGKTQAPVDELNFAA